MTPLTIGAKLIIAKPKGHLDPDYMADLITSEGVTNMLASVPTLVSVLLIAENRGSLDMAAIECSTSKLLTNGAVFVCRHWNIYNLL